MPYAPDFECLACDFRDPETLHHPSMLCVNVNHQVHGPWHHDVPSGLAGPCSGCFAKASARTAPDTTFRLDADPQMLLQSVADKCYQ